MMKNKSELNLASNWEMYFQLEFKKTNLIQSLLNWVYWAREQISLLKNLLLISYNNEMFDYMVELQNNVDNSLNIINKNIYL